MPTDNFVTFHDHHCTCMFCLYPGPVVMLFKAFCMEGCGNDSIPSGEGDFYSNEYIYLYIVKIGRYFDRIHVY